MICPRTLFTTTVVKDKIYAVGGFCDQGVLSTPSIEFYSPIENNWSALNIDSVIPRTSHGAVAAKGDKFLIFGGEGVNGAIKTCHSIDVNTKTAEEIKFVEGDKVPEIFYHVHTNNHDDILVFGGFGNTAVYNYNITENKWTLLENLSKNLLEIINYDIMQNEREIVTQADLLLKVFLVLRPSSASY